MIENNAHDRWSQPRTKKRFGQHFLIDAGVIQQIINTLGATPDQHIVEIGPGTGVLTRPLIESGAQVTAIELDRDLAVRLRHELAAYPNFRLFEADALNFDYPSLALDGAKLRIVGNLPYNISTPLLFTFLALGDRVTDLCFMLQKEVAARVSAPPGCADYGRLSVMLQAHFEVLELFDVEPYAFNPPPKVQSRVLLLRPRVTELATGKFGQLESLVALAFSQRRKMLRHTLGKQVPLELLSRHGISLEMRAENVKVGQFVALANSLPAKTSEISG